MPAEFAQQFEASAQTITTWVAQADRDDGQRHHGLTRTERQAWRPRQR
jgi:transposase